MNVKKLAVFDDAEETTTKKSTPCFGIDLGTTNSAISVLRNGKIPDIITLKSGKNTLPSCVLWTGKGDEFIVGDEAYNSRYKDNAIYSVKRMMGTDEKIVLKYGGKEKVLKPEEVSALILKELATQASLQYGEVKDVVITVPAYFNNKQLEATRKAGELAGLNVIKTFREPTSASLLYNVDDTIKSEAQVLVYDLGGGTFDVSLVKISKISNTKELDTIYGFKSSDISDESGNLTLSVLRTDGDSHLGGDDIDNELYNILEEKLIEQGIDVKYIPREVREELKLRLEQKKKISAYGHLLNLEFKLQDSKGTKVSTQIPLVPNDFYRATNVVYQKTKRIMENTLSGINMSLIDSIVLVGGSTKSEVLKTMLKKDFPLVKIDDALNPDESVALGAAVEAKRAKYGDKSVNVFDVLPLSIGVLADGKIKKLIMRNQVVPFSVTRVFSTSRDNQESIAIQIYQGNSSRPEECINLGTLVLKDIPKGKAHKVVIKVKLEVNAEGILKCAVQVGDKYKDIVLTNLFTGQDDKSENKPKLDKLSERKLKRWRSLAKKLDSNIGFELNRLLSDFENGNATEEQVVAFIQEHKPKEVDTVIKRTSVVAES